MKKTMKIYVNILLLSIWIILPLRGLSQEPKAEQHLENSEFPKVSFMTNIEAREKISLNGKWKAIIDPVDLGIKSWVAIWKDKKATGPTDFYKYSFDEGPVLDVPGDFNSQLPELKFFESTVWYKKVINYDPKQDKRAFLYFGAANYICDVWLNSEKLGSHEGGFAPFQFEITDKVKTGENTIIVRVNNERHANGIPDKGYDWLNYGGITRDVYLVETPKTYIQDYFVHLSPNNNKEIHGWIATSGEKKRQKIEINIPELKARHTVTTDENGRVDFSFTVKAIDLWCPEDPKLYKVQLSSETDKIEEEIGFRSIEVRGTEIF